MLSAISTLVRLVSADVRLVVTEARRPEKIDLELNGVALSVGPWATTSILELMQSGAYEAPERQIVLATLRPDDVVLELGSGAGYLTTIAAGIAADVRSFDANPEMVSVARTTVANNGRQATVTNAVLSRDGGGGFASFYLAGDYAGSSLIPIAGAGVIEVPVLDFTDALDGCSYLIVDIEGAEADLLRGAIPNVERICVECHPGVVGLAKIVEMVRSLRDQGFALDSELSQGQVLYLERSSGTAG